MPEFSQIKDLLLFNDVFASYAFYTYGVSLVLWIINLVITNILIGYRLKNYYEYHPFIDRLGRTDFFIERDHGPGVLLYLIPFMNIVGLVMNIWTFGLLSYVIIKRYHEITIVSLPILCIGLLWLI